MFVKILNRIRSSKFNMLLVILCAISVYGLVALKNPFVITLLNFLYRLLNREALNRYALLISFFILFIALYVLILIIITVISLFLVKTGKVKLDE